MTPRLPDSLATERLRLREPARADATAIFQSYTQDAKVCRFMVWTPHRSENETRKFLAWCVEAWAGGKTQPYVITSSGNETPIGMIEARLQAATVDIGYVLAHAHWGQGLMPEAINAVTQAALASPAIFRVQATCDTDNLGSQRALEKSGFLREGRLERYTVHPNI